MKKSRLIFFSIFGGYHLIVVILTFYIKHKAGQGDFGSLYSLLSSVALFLYGALLGLVLLIIDFIWSLRDSKQSEGEVEELHLENNTLKAKIYDLQEKDKQASTVNPPTVK
jgi:hypothetical protein